MKINTLKAKIVERNTNISAVAKALGLSKSTFYRRLKNEGRDFSVEEVKKISNYLNLTAKEATNIFFNEKSHKCY